MAGRHHTRRWWALHPRGVAAGAFAVVAVLVVGVGAAVGPRPAVDQALPLIAEPDQGHASGTKPWPTVVPPSIGAPGAWDPDATPAATSPSPTPTTEQPTPTPCSRCGDRTPATTTTPPPAPTPSTPPPAPTTPPPPPPPVDDGGGGEVDAGSSQPGVAAELLQLVNRDRLANGCGPVTLHPSLIEQSQAHAERQAADDAMSHSGGVDGFDTWGENVAYGYDTAAAVHDAWMGSPGHRANILNCAFTVMGAGTADSATGVRYWTEQFAVA